MLSTIFLNSAGSASARTGKHAAMRLYLYRKEHIDLNTLLFVLLGSTGIQVFGGDEKRVGLLQLTFKVNDFCLVCPADCQQMSNP